MYELLDDDDDDDPFVGCRRGAGSGADDIAPGKGRLLDYVYLYILAA